jgi:DNA-directed RNA polymerase subunit RPC12/RpoP
MGQRRTCPKCEAVFIAGKSVAESAGRVNGTSRRGLLERAAEEQQAAPQVAAAATKPVPGSGADRTMLAELDALIRYNCPRCKKPLESPASEGGTKKPCPSCGGRLQVPAAPPPASAAAATGLNKTLLADAAVPQSFAPRPTVAPMMHPPAAMPMGVAVGQPHRSNVKKYVIGGIAAAVVLLAFLFFLGKRNADFEFDKAMAAQKAQLEQLKMEIEQKSALLQQQQEIDAKMKSRWEEERARQEARQRDFERERENELRRLAMLSDEKQAADAKAKLEQKQREIEDEKRRAAEERAKAERDMHDQLDSLKRQLDNANKTTTVIQQAPPPAYPWYYYGGPRPYHPYWGW